MARPIDADKFKESLVWHDEQGMIASIEDVLDIIDSIPTYTQPNNWISVKDRLPEEPGHYLVITSINYWHGGCLDKNPTYHGTTKGYENTAMSVLDCYFDSTGDWNRVCNCHVTHWQPLPEPPKED